MNIQDIENFIKRNTDEKSAYVKISFKKRDHVYGLFIRDTDYEHLKSKNFWRIVTKHSLDAYQKTGDVSLARIFSGHEFSRLSTYSEAF